jgi:hypothetical protein
MSEPLVTRMARAMEAEALRFNKEREVPVGQSRTFNTGEAQLMTRRLALAALRAIREPSIQQMAPGVSAYVKINRSCRPVALRAGWNAVINAAIAEAGAQE